MARTRSVRGLRSWTLFEYERTDSERGRTGEDGALLTKTFARSIRQTWRRASDFNRYNIHMKRLPFSSMAANVFASSADLMVSLKVLRCLSASLAGVSLDLGFSAIRA